MIYKTFEIINGELFINEPTKQRKGIASCNTNNLKSFEPDYKEIEMASIWDELEYGADLIDIGDE